MINKIKIFLQSTKIIKNWYVLPLIYYKFGKKKYVILKTKSGLKIKLRIHSTDFMQFATIWLIREYSEFKFLIKDDDVIIDIGSHIGIFALFASQYCKKGKIFCFEPINENFKLLKENIKINKISNIYLFNNAVSDTSSTITLYLNEDDSGHSKFIKTSKSVEVTSKSLKELLDENKIEQCDLLKLDCEGSEYEILESLPLEYFKKFKKIIIEYHLADSKPKLIKELKIKLINLSYKISIKPLSKDIGFLYAKNIK